jgi:hypothetical protein
MTWSVWFWVEAWGRPSSQWRCWLVHRGGIIRVVLGLRTRWASNVGSYLVPNTKVCDGGANVEITRENSDGLQ